MCSLLFLQNEIAGNDCLTVIDLCLSGTEADAYWFREIRQGWSDVFLLITFDLLSMKGSFIQEIVQN